MMALVSDPADLLAAARRLASDAEPWADTVYCSRDDYRAAGLCGDATKTAIRLPLIGRASDLSPFTHPLSKERKKEDAERYRASVHFVRVVPHPLIENGRITT